MTASIKKALSNGTSDTPANGSDKGLAALRRHEAKSLISLVCEAMYQANGVASQMHSSIYNDNDQIDPDQLDPLLSETVNCWQTADHYLRMLADLVAEIGHRTETPF